MLIRKEAHVAEWDVSSRRQGVKKRLVRGMKRRVCAVLSPADTSFDCAVKP